MSREYFRLIPAVYLILKNQDKVLLLKRANTGYQDGKYGLVSGHVDGNEPASMAMVREAKEEAGITIDPKKLKLVHVSHRLNREHEYQERLDMFFELKEWQGEIQNLETSKCDGLSWHSLDNLPSETIPLIRLVLKDIRNAVNYSEYLTEPE